MLIIYILSKLSYCHLTQANTSKMHSILHTALKLHAAKQNLRLICSNSYRNLHKNFYNLLKISPSASQKEIKHAYYKLSMQHHPDKNQGCESSAKVFREITSAYEVLGNSSKREAYDRRFGFTREKKKDNPGNHFKKKNMDDWTNSSSKNECKYDFDEWYRQHYSNMFKMEREAREKGKEREKEFEKFEEEKIQAIITCLMAGSMILAFFLLGKIPMDRKMMPKRYR